MKKPNKLNKIDNDGETIITSENAKDLDIESLVEPLEEKQKYHILLEKESKEDNHLFVKAKLYCSFYPYENLHKMVRPGPGTDPCERTFEGKLVTYLLHHTEETISFIITVEEALLLTELHKHTPGSKEARIELSYVHHDEPDVLRKYKEKKIPRLLQGVEITSIENSSCVVTVKLNRVL